MSLLKFTRSGRSGGQTRNFEFKKKVHYLNPQQLIFYHNCILSFQIWNHQTGASAHNVQDQQLKKLYVTTSDTAKIYLSIITISECDYRIN